MSNLTRLIDWWGLFFAALVFVPLEWLTPRRRQPVLRKGWTADIAYIVINGLFVRFGLALLLTVLISAARFLLPSEIGGFVARQPIWLQAIEAVVLGDFCLYWAHRALHAHPLLWRFHAIHHAVEDLDWVAAYHTHPIDDLILSGAAIGSICILGFSPIAIAIYVAIFGWVSFAVHANTRLTIGPLRWFAASPEFHHWHHSNDAEARDRNFASIIAFWDVAFGTVFLPRKRLPMSFGTNEPIPSGYADQLLYPFRRQPPAPTELEGDTRGTVSVLKPLVG